MEKTKLFQAPTQPTAPFVSKRGGRVIHISFDEVEGFFKQQIVGATIQSNDSEHVSHIFSRNKWAISLQNCAQFLMRQFL
jgi:hypothetical protein